MLIQVYRLYYFGYGKNTDLEVKDILVWQKSNPTPRNINRRYVQDMEFAIWAVKKKGKWVFNRPKNEPYVRGLYTTPLVSGKERTKHPTQKSLDLMERIISIHSKERETILDPFMAVVLQVLLYRDRNEFRVF